MDQHQKNLTPLSQMLGNPTTQVQEVEERLNTFVATTCVRCKSDFSYQLYLDRECAEKGWGRFAKKVCPNCLLEHEAEREKQDNHALESYRTACMEYWLGDQKDNSNPWLISGIPDRYHKKRFHNFTQSFQPEAYILARQYAELMGNDVRYGDSRWDSANEEFLPMPSLFLASRGNGTGKTHLAAAIGLKVLNDSCCDISGPRSEIESCPVFFVTAPLLFLRIRATYQEGASESEQGIIRRITEAPLVILDDVGKEKPSDHTRQTYFTIIETRYNACEPMVITSNLVLPEQIKELTNLMGQASVSRLKEMTEGWRVTMDGKDYRFRESKSFDLTRRAATCAAGGEWDV